MFGSWAMAAGACDIATSAAATYNSVVETDRAILLRELDPAARGHDPGRGRGAMSENCQSGTPKTHPP